jgi:hypothetical protein
MMSFGCWGNPTCSTFYDDDPKSKPLWHAEIKILTVSLRQMLTGQGA